MRGIILLPVYGRFEITEFCYKSLKSQIAKFDIKVLVIYSEEAHRDLAHKYGFNTIYAENKPLGKKLNTGLAAALAMRSDFIMTMGSDNTFHDTFWKEVSKILKMNLPCFGFMDVCFTDWKTKEKMNLRYPGGHGVGRVYQTPMLRKIASHRKYVQIKTGKKIVVKQTPGLWGEDLNVGLDQSAEAKLKSFGIGVHLWKGIFVTDWKSDENIHSFQELKENTEKATK